MGRKHKHKKKFNPRTHVRSAERRIIRKRKRVRNLIIFTIILFLASTYLISSSCGPKKISRKKNVNAIQIDDITVSKLRREVTELIEKFDKKVQRETAVFEDLELLELAMDKQAELSDTLAIVGDFSEKDKIDKIELKYHDFGSNILFKESDKSEKAAKKFIRRDNFEQGIKQISKALEIQEKINRMYPKGEKASAMRVAELRILLTEYKIQPALLEIKSIETKGDEFFEQLEIDKAEENYNLAVQKTKQIQVSLESKNAAYALVLQRLNGKLLECKATKIHLRINTIVEEADDAYASQKYDLALNKYARAIETQELINSEYQSSKHASIQRVIDLQKAKNNTLAKPDVDSLIQLDQELQNTLKKKDFETTKTLIDKCLKKLEIFSEKHPGNELLPREFKLKYDYLNILNKQIETIYYQVMTSLVELDSIKMFESEVSQELYTKVIGQHSSRNLGAELPVDSVNWEDANNFCTRISWITAEKVRLPKLEEYEKYSDLENIESHCWHSGNSERKTHPIKSPKHNKFGLYNLLGNVQEWVYTDEKSSRIYQVFGSSIKDDLETIKTKASKEMLQKERNRFTGFRFVVE